MFSKRYTYVLVPTRAWVELLFPGWLFWLLYLAVQAYRFFTASTRTTAAVLTMLWDAQGLLHVQHYIGVSQEDGGAPKQYDRLIEGTRTVHSSL